MGFSCFYGAEKVLNFDSVIWVEPCIIMYVYGDVKGKKGSGPPWQSYFVSLAIWDHTVYNTPATQHKWTHSALTRARQAGTWFIYPGGMEGWVALVTCYIPRWFTGLQTVTHPSTN